MLFKDAQGGVEPRGVPAALEVGETLVLTLDPPSNNVPNVRIGQDAASLQLLLPPPPPIALSSRRALSRLEVAQSPSSEATASPQFSRASSESDDAAVVEAAVSDASVHMAGMVVTGQLLGALGVGGPGSANVGEGRALMARLIKRLRSSCQLSCSGTNNPSAFK